MSSPKISVCIPTYNYGQYLTYAIKSVLNQSYRNFELVICDDASTDNTKNVVEGFDDKRIRYIRNDANIGIAPNFNKCVRESKGLYLKFLCADDWFQPNLLEKFSKIMDNYWQVGLVLSAMRWVDPNGYLITIAETFSGGTIIPGEKAFNHFLTKGNGGASLTSLMIRRKCFEELGFFKNLNDKGWGSNWEMNMRISAHFDVAYLDEPLASVRRHNQTATHKAYDRDEDISWDYKVLQCVFQNSEGVYLPVDQATKREALTRISQKAISRSARYLKQGKFPKGIQLFKTAYKYDGLIRNILSFSRLWLRSKCR